MDVHHFKKGIFMLTYFIKVTLRKMYREKLYTIINVAGLSLGIACCLILGLFLHNELTYDQHHKKYKNIYRIAASDLSPNGGERKLALTSHALAPVLKKENAEIIDYVRIYPISLSDDPGIPVYSGDDVFFWNDVCIADDNVFEVFTYDIIYGNPKTALVDPNSVAVSESFARKYFGDENPIGKTVRTDIATMKISLVFADLPENTHLKTDMLLSYNGPASEMNPSNLHRDLWQPADYTYLVLPENYSQASFKKMMDDFYLKYMKEIGDADNMSMAFWLQPLKDIHYGPDDLLIDRPTGNALYLYGSAMIGLLILLVACINYMNLATARSLKRGREVGIHKVLGSKKMQLILQFMGESIFISLLALFVGMIIVELLLIFTPVNGLIGGGQLADYITEPILFWCLLGVTILTGVLSGAYPAFYLSSISPIAAITSIKKAATSQLKMRQVLVLAQLIISIGVIAGTFLMIFQMRYITDKPLGYDIKNRVVVNLQGADLIEKHRLIKSKLLKSPNVRGMTVCHVIPGMTVGTIMQEIENNEGLKTPQYFYFILVHNDDYLNVLGLKLLEGRDFSSEITSDAHEAVIVNEAMVKKMGWENPLGKAYGDERKVVGVVRDFHFQSMHSTVKPLALVRHDNDYFAEISDEERAQARRKIVVHISEQNIPEALDHIRTVIGQVDPGHTVKLEFLDDIIDRLYVFEKRVIGLAGVFAGICVFISCLGLFGLSAFVTEQRSKEIGVRKVLGASIMQIIFMLFKPTLILVLIASVVASAVTYIAIDGWLSGFAYRAGINPVAFLLGAAIVVAVAFSTIVLQSLKTARANPVKALRYE